MAIIRPTWSPYIEPQAAQLSPNVRGRRSSAVQQLFQPQPSQQPLQLMQSFAGNNMGQQAPVATNTFDRLREQLSIGTEKARQLPRHNPVANDPVASTHTNAVTNFINTSNVKPSFQEFYNQLQTTEDYGNEATAAEAARAVHRKNKLLEQLNELGNDSFANAVSGRSGGSTRTVPGGPGPNPKGADRTNNQRVGQELAAQSGWTGALWDAFNKLVMKESGWNNNAQNPTSTAFGIGQFLDSTWKGYGIGKTSDPRLQIIAMIRYIKARYGDPIKALQFHLNNNWY